VKTGYGRLDTAKSL